MTTIENRPPIGLVRVEDSPEVFRIENPEVRLPFDLKHALIRAAITSNGKEICGFITSRMSPYFVYNSSATPEKNFEMAPADYRRAIEMICASGEDIVGVFHSHPSDVDYPGEQDMAGWPNPDLNWRYFIVTSVGVYEYMRP